MYLTTHNSTLPLLPPLSLLPSLPFFFLQNHMSDLEILCSLIAAAVHDVGHPGIDNRFHVASKHELALLYNDRSVLENYHAAYAFRLLMKPDNNILAHLPPAVYDEARKLIIDMVLATDLSHHFDFLSSFNKDLGSNSFSTSNPKMRHVRFECPR